MGKGSRFSTFIASVREHLAPTATKKEDGPRTPDTDATKPEEKKELEVQGAEPPATPEKDEGKDGTKDAAPDGSADSAGGEAAAVDAGGDSPTPPTTDTSNTESITMAAATMAELKAAFPGDKHMAFREECIEKSLELPAAKALMGERLLAKTEADEKAAAEKAQKDKLLGGAGKSELKGGAAPVEQSGQVAPRTFTKDELLSPTTGKIGPVPGAETYAQAVAGYRSAGIKDAEYWAQVNHRDLWLPEREKRGEQHMASHGSREADRNKRK